MRTSARCATWRRDVPRRSCPTASPTTAELGDDALDRADALIDDRADRGLRCERVVDGGERMAGGDEVRAGISESDADSACQ